MAGSSPGTSRSTSGSVSGELRGGVGEACCDPCKRGCAPGECIVKLPKSFFIGVIEDEEREYVKVEVWDHIYMQRWKLPVDNLVRTISTCHEMEEVRIRHKGHSSRGVAEALKAVCESLKTVPSLKKLLIDSEYHDWSVLDAEAIFSVLGANSTVPECRVILNMKASEDRIVRVLVDALLHNQALQQFELKVCGGSRGIAEVIRYMRAPSNVLTSLHAYDLSDEEVVEVGEALDDNKQLKELVVKRDSRGSGRGVGRIGEALRTNCVLEELTIDDTEMGGEEMEALVGALVPDPTCALQPNAHLHTLGFYDQSIENKDGMEQVATLLRTNTSLRHISFLGVDILRKGHVDLMTAAQMLFTALQSNASLLTLDLLVCKGIGGIEVLGMIMDMLLHNHTLRKIYLLGTGMDEDGGAEVVYAELRARRGKEIDLKLEEFIHNMDHVRPNSARVFLCGHPQAGKTTLCQRWAELDGNELLVKSMEIKANERTRGIEVHKMKWADMLVSIWDMAGQEEYRTFHEMILPNQCAAGECCYYLIVCNPLKHFDDTLNTGGLELNTNGLEKEINYWLLFLASNTRPSKAYRPHVTILMSHHDLWPSNKTLSWQLNKSVTGLKESYKDVLDFDADVFIEMENKKSCIAAQKIKGRIQEYLVELSSRVPQVLNASLELQSHVRKWQADHEKGHDLKWEDFSKNICENVEDLTHLRVKDEVLLEKVKKHVVTLLHSGGHVMYFEELDMVIMNPHWFCNEVMGNILFYLKQLTKDGVISLHDFSSIWVNICKTDLDGSFDHNFEEILWIMTKLQICYEDRFKDHDKVMIPSLLSQTLDTLNWTIVFGEKDGVYKYLGTKLTSREDTLAMLSEGFFSRLQVFLHGKFESITYKVYSNAISFNYEDINVIISYKDGSIIIMSRRIGEEVHANRNLHKEIIRNINDLRQSPTFGCPGVILEDHIIMPRCVKYASEGDFHSIARNRLKVMVLKNPKYVHHWNDNKGLSHHDHPKDLLGDEEWKQIFGSKVMVTELGDKLNGSNDKHKEVMDRFQEMETKIIRSQETFAAQGRANYEHLMEILLLMKNAKIPKLPYIVKTERKRGFHAKVLKMIPGLVSYRLYFRCEHNDHDLHIVENQPGCGINVGDAKTRKFGIVMYWSLFISTLIAKAGAHVVAGAGNMVPDLAREFATALDTPGLLDLANPLGDLSKHLPMEIKKNPIISLEDNQVALEWLSKLLEGKRKSRSMYEMFMLTEGKYTSKSSQRSEIGWVCDDHKDKK